MVFYGYDGKDYHVVKCERRRRGLVRVEYIVPGFGNGDPVVTFLRIEEARERLGPALASK